MTLNIILKNSNCRIVTLPAIPLAVTLPPAYWKPIFNYHNATLYSEINFRITLSHQRLYAERV